ncbi:MAG: rpiB [Myxococcaceae bacterium]|nr:rpiB [Myxococcaceae bacterium]
MKTELVTALKELKLDFDDLGPADATSVDYPDYAQKVAEAVAGGRAQLGVLVCGSGIGMSISANKFHGVRAALCHTEFEARVARGHNDANVLCLGQRVTGPGVARGILEEFVKAPFEGGRHANRVNKILAQEKQR